MNDDETLVLALWCAGDFSWTLNTSGEGYDTCEQKARYEQ